jgi:hypothetical protein
MDSVIDLEDVCARFRRIDLHDCQLRGVSLQIRQDNSTTDAHLSVIVLGGTYPDFTWTPGRLIFLDCTYSKIEIDHAMNHVSGDAIIGTTCSRESDLRHELESGLLKHEEAPLSEYVEFVVGLCPPGGELHFFARDFSFEVDQ